MAAIAGSGLLLVSKPAGWTSHDVVARVRRISGLRRGGHTGTLDPMATGLLVVCLGAATRLIPFIEESVDGDAKEYEATVRFGFETETDDAMGARRDGGVAMGPGPTLPTQERLQSALPAFTGILQQVPPAYSAKKVEGERAYDLARKGLQVDLPPVQVTVSRIELLSLQGDEARIRVRCSRGTYIRSLARDIGRALGCGAHLAALKRTEASGFHLRDAAILDDLTPEMLQARLVPMREILPAWPERTVNADEANELSHGRSLPAQADEGARFRLTSASGDLVALGRVEAGRVRPFCVF